jgi:hypothetical protein
MQNKSKFLEEISRMIELSESNQNKANLLKESFKSKILKEADDDEFDFFDLDDEEGDGDENNKGGEDAGDGYEKLSPDDDIPLLLKLALTTNSINSFQKEIFELSDKNFLKFKDLYSKEKKQGEDSENVEYVPSKALYPGMTIEQFRDYLRKNRLVLKVGNESEEITQDTTDKVFKWLSTKSLHNIGLQSGGMLSAKGNAQLNFLARIISNKPKDDVERLILSQFKDAAKNNAMRILFDFYKVAAKNTLLPSLNMQPTPENLDTIVDGVTQALNNLAGVSGAKMDVKETSWKPSEYNIGPWILQVAKNYAKNALKKETEYVLNAEKATMFLEDMLNREGKITFYSQKDPSAITYPYSASNVSEVKNSEGKTYKYVYIYNDVESALDDLESMNRYPNHHLNVNIQKISPKDYKELFKSTRTGVSAMSPEVEKDTEEIAGYEDKELSDLTGIDKSAELEIRRILGKVVDFMTLDPATYGVKQATHDPNNLSVEDKAEIKAGKSPELIRKRKVLAKENAINFMYNFLLSGIGKTPYGEDIASKGNWNPGTMRTWIDSQREKMLKDLISIEKKNNPNITVDEIKNRAEKLGLLIKGEGLDGDITYKRFNQAFKNGLYNYFKQNKEDFKEVLDLISTTPPEGYEVTPDIETIFEQKIRAKIRKMLQESFVISEEEEDFMDNISNLDKQINVAGKRFENVLSGKYSPEDLKSEIFKAIEEGEYIKWNYENSKKHGQHKYISSVLASIYNLLNSKQQENVITYMFLTFFPTQMDSQLIRTLSSKLSGGDFYSNSDVAWDAVVSSDPSGRMLIEKALENYSPGKGVFRNLLIEYIFREARNIQKERTSHVEKGERVWTSSISIDKENEEGMALKDKIHNISSSEIEVEELREKLDNLISKIENKKILSNSELNLLKDARLFINDIVDKSGLNYELLSTRINTAIERGENVNTKKPISVSNIGSQMSSITKKIKKAKEDGLI